jgi:hypothetical protein
LVGWWIGTWDQIYIEFTFIDGLYFL